MESRKSKILLVEDDLSMGFLLSEFLEGEGFEVKLCRDGDSGLLAYRRGQFDLALLDVMMPKMDGFTLAQRLRLEDPELPFLFLTARSLKADKLRGFQIGADDYITKPFDEDELLCRIQVMLRRNQDDAEKARDEIVHFSIGEYCFDYTRRELTWQDKLWRLTEREAEVLRLLCLFKNQILRRDEAVERIYGKRDYFLGRSFDVFISKIRKLLQNDPGVTIENVFGVGFILHLPE
jgi:DNA-binding response OmpR family regulator